MRSLSGTESCRVVEGELVATGRCVCSGRRDWGFVLGSCKMDECWFRVEQRESKGDEAKMLSSVAPGSQHCLVTEKPSHRRRE